MLGAGNDLRGGRALRTVDDETRRRSSPSAEHDAQMRACISTAAHADRQWKTCSALTALAREEATYSQIFLMFRTQSVRLERQHLRLKRQHLRCPNRS
eukprot:6207071-Pleurochrysis_carterae.AAC.3